MSATICSWQTVLKWARAMAAHPEKRKAPAAIEDILRCVDRRQVRNWRVAADVYDTVKTEINCRFRRFRPSHALELARLAPRSRWAEWIEEVEDSALTVKQLRGAIEAEKAKPQSRPPLARRKRKVDWQIRHGDCITEMRKLGANSCNAAILSPPYPGIKREYGTWKPDEWLAWMQNVMAELRRVITPRGSAVVVIQPNNKRTGQRHTWPWRFALNMAEMWGIVQDAYWIKPVSFPTSAATQHGLMRNAVEWCLWLGNANCYRKQDGVLWDYGEGMLRDMARRAYLTDDLETLPHGGTKRARRMLNDNAGATPMNCLACAPQGYNGHPASFPEKLAQFWVRYIASPKGCVLDPFCGTGTTGVACLKEGVRFVGIEANTQYVEQAKNRLRQAAAT